MKKKLTVIWPVLLEKEKERERGGGGQIKKCIHTSLNFVKYLVEKKIKKKRLIVVKVLFFCSKLN